MCKLSGAIGTARAAGSAIGSRVIQDNSPIKVSPANRLAAVELRIAERRLRNEFFPRELLVEPAWDVLLDLYRGALEQRALSAHHLSVAAAVSESVTLRWISALVGRGLVTRGSCSADPDAASFTLTETGLAQMDAYFARLSPDFPASAES